MSNKHSLRFSVTDGKKKASTWSIVVHKKKPEVYIFNRLLGSIHVSFHGSGKWHIKFGDIEEKKRVSFTHPVEDSYMTKWDRPENQNQFVTTAFRIITPWGALQNPKFFDRKKYFPIPNAQECNSTEIIILFVDADKQLDVKNATVVGSLPISSGEQVVVVYSQIPSTIRQATGPTTIPDFSDRVTIFNLLRGNIGAILFGEASDGSRVMWEYAVHITLKGYKKIIWSKFKKFINTYVKKI